MHVPAVVPPVTHVDAAVSIDPGPDAEAVSVVPSGAGVHVVPSADCSTVAVNVCDTPTKFVAGASNDTRYPNHVFDAVTGTTCDAACPGAPGTVRSTTNVPSVTEITVNVPVPGDGDTTDTVQIPAVSVVHDVGGVAVPAPVQVYAIVAPPPDRHRCASP